MKKIIELGDEFFATGEATVQPVLPWGSGRVDASRITKHASEALDYIKNVAPEPGKTQLLLLALGGSETYGPNRNGDGFPEHPVSARGKIKSVDRKWFVPPGEELTHHYQSFEKNPAHAFKHHCFPAGTLVVCEGRERRAIEEIQVGDRVETLEGLAPVTEVMVRHYEGAGVSLRLKGLVEPLIATADHPVRALRREAVHCPHRYNYFQSSFGCNYAACKAQAANQRVPEWIPASEVLPGDYLLMPKPSLGAETVPVEFARLVGWVASEGYLGKRGQIGFTFSANNATDIDSVTACLKAHGVHVNVSDKPQYKTVQLTACSKELHARLSEYVVGTFNNKHVTAKILTWGEDALRHFLGAYIDGDGHVAMSGKNTGQLRIRSSSPAMLSMLADIIRGLSVPATQQWDIPAGEMTSPTNGKTYPHHGSGVVAVEAVYVPDICKYSRKTVVRDVRTPRVKLVNGEYLVQVTEREDIFLNETVYNLEVEGPHHYVANEVVVHNCNRDPSKASGYVKKAFWNPRMHRVELLVSVDNEKDPEWVQRTNDGEFVPVSMGCRIKRDVCSICGNEAPTRAQYCDHAKYQMNEILPDGQKVYVHNPSPDFFDISRVFRPADRTGYTLKKVAYVHEIRLSADLGERVDALALKSAVAQKLSDMNKMIEATPVATSVRTPADDAFIVKFRDHAQKTLKKSASIDVRPLQPYPLGEIVHASLKTGFLLRDTEFIPLATSKLAGQWLTLSQDTLRKTAAAAKIAIDAFAEHPELLDELIEGDAFNAQKCANEVVSFFEQAREKRGYAGEYLYRRLVPEGVGLRRDEKPNTDVLHVGDYVTTRGAARDAQDAITRAHAQKILGGGALLLGGYKALAAAPGLKRWRPALALGTGYGAVKTLSGRPDDDVVMSDEGVPVPTSAEFIHNKTASAVLVHLIECSDSASMRRAFEGVKVSADTSLDNLAQELGAVILT